MKTINYPGLENYQITNDGKVYSIIKNRWLRNKRTICGHITHSLYNTISNQRKTYSTPNLIALTYINNPNPENNMVGYKDYNRQNITQDNLQWTSRSENTIRNNKNNPQWPDQNTIKYKTNGTMKRIEVYQWGKYLKTYESVKLLCEGIKINRDKYNRIVNGKSKKLCNRYSFKEIADESAI